MPTPAPGTIPSLDLMEEGGSAVPADPRAVRELIARVQALLADTPAVPGRSNPPGPRPA